MTFVRPYHLIDWYDPMIPRGKLAEKAFIHWSSTIWSCSYYQHFFKRVHKKLGDFTLLQEISAKGRLFFKSTLSKIPELRRKNKSSTLESQTSRHFIQVILIHTFTPLRKQRYHPAWPTTKNYDSRNNKTPHPRSKVELDITRTYLTKTKP